MASRLEVTSPYDRHHIAEFAMNTASDVESALATAERLSKDRSTWIPAHERIAILEKTAAIVTSRKDELARQAAEEGGKPLIDSRVELERAVQGIRVAIESLALMHGQEVPMGLTASSRNRLALTIREPIGVAVAVSAFNHPFNLIVHQVIPAIAVGCPVIVKPASTTPISCMNLAKILYEAGLPRQWCQVMLVDRDLSEKLVTDSRVNFFSFIGSGEVGWRLRSKLAPGVRYALEHGGAAPVIFEPDADMNDAVPLLAKGGFYHAGQVCVSVQRIYAHDSVVAKLSEQIVAAAKKMKVGDPLDATTEVGPLILEKEVARVDEWVNEGAKSGKLLCGGKKLSDTTYAPTVILNPSDGARVSTTEIFGPVVCIYSYRNRLEAIARANSLPYSFQSSVFTKNVDVALDTMRRLDAATVLVNDHTAFRVDWMPFGGHRHSGVGVGGIPYSMKELTQEKLCVFRSTLI